MNSTDAKITYDVIARMVVKSNPSTDRIYSLYSDLVEKYALSEDNDYLINQIKRSLV